MVYVETIEGPHAIGANASHFDLPIYASAIGRVVLAFLPQFELEDILNNITFESITPQTIKSKEQLLDEIQIIKENGFAVNNQEIEIGEICVAVPVFNNRNYPIASISVSGPAFRMTDERISFIAQQSIIVAKKLSLQLGSDSSLF